MDNLFARKRTILWFLIPGLLIYFFSALVPIGMSAYYSLLKWDGLSDPAFVGLANYLRMFRDAELGQAVLRTLVMTVGEMILIVGGGLLLAYLLTRIHRFRQTFIVVYCVPIVISTAALAQMFKLIFSVQPTGLVNTVLSWFDPSWAHLEWLTNPQTSLALVTFVDSFANIPTYMLILYAALLNVPDSLREAAKIDGAGAARTFWSIEIPYIRPIIGTVAFLVLNHVLRSYDIPWLLTSGGPINSSEVQSIYMYKQLFNSQDYGYGSAIAILIVVMCLVFGFVVRAATDRKSIA
ncbi:MULTISPECIES: carbohydrate ABC transporter permease [unclassified Microbacterium]|uniref:carbohydrate ABC transporter permease n=1 Tax=unclassified Microbacterium TaxID=2609290 RepID=UPI00301A317F